jgi:hypothetical protein
MADLQTYQFRVVGADFRKFCPILCAQDLPVSVIISGQKKPLSLPFLRQIEPFLQDICPGADGLIVAPVEKGGLPEGTFPGS